MNAKTNSIIIIIINVIRTNTDGYYMLDNSLLQIE